VSSLRVLAARVAGWLRRSQRERDLIRELHANIQLHIDDNLRAGMPPHEARRAALIKFGGIDQTRDAMRELWSIRWIETLWQDMRYALRGLRRAPGFSITAILSLALGLGGSVAIFTIADSLLLRPLPYQDPSQLVIVWEAKRGAATTQNVVNPANYRDWKQQNDVFASMAAFAQFRVVLTVDKRAEEVDRQIVSAEFLPLLGVPPLRGRWFTPEEDKPGTPSSIIISYHLWQTWFGGADDIIGRQVQLNSTPRTIVGVMPADFYFLDRAVEFWEPIGLDPAASRRGRFMMVLARLKPGVDRDRAQTAMTLIAQRLEGAFPDFDAKWGVNVEPLRDALVGPVRASVLILLGAVALLLLVACANVAGLLLARYAVRRREMAVRASLGAGRLRVVRQLLTESVVLGLLSGLLGVAVAKWMVAALVAVAPPQIVRSAVIAIDWRIVGFGALLAVLTSVIFGLAPALVTTRKGLMDAVRHDSRASIGTGGRLRAWLVGAEVALCVVLLTGAVLLFRSLVGLQAVDPGLDPSNLLTFRVSLPPPRYPDVSQRVPFFARAIDEIAQLPGVRSAAAVSVVPFKGVPSGTTVFIEGQPPAKPGEELSAAIRTVTPNYFRTMGIPLRSGRDFTAADNRVEAPVRFIVNEAFVRKYLGGAPPLEARVSARMDTVNPFGDIIGVVGDVKEGSLDKAPRPTVYYVHARLANSGLVIVVRTDGPRPDLGELARRAVARIDPAQPIADVLTMDEVLGLTMARQRFSATLMVAFSLGALLLAAIGIYGVLAYSVSQRTREIGVRVALGAEPSRIVWLIVAAGARIVLAGTVAGVAGALLLSGLLESLLFGIAPRDPLTFALVPATLALVGLAAAALPARRAVNLDPTDALRTD
jgi:putative ABC transport system permease protein